MGVGLALAFSPCVTFTCWVLSRLEMSPADRCRNGSSGTGTSRVPGLPPSSRSAARSLEQLQQEAQASGACAFSQSRGSTEEMGAQENHTPGLGPRDFFDPVVTARPMSPASCAVVMPYDACDSCV